MGSLVNPVWTLKLVRENTPDYRISSSTDVYELIKSSIFPKLTDSNIERFYFIGLNTANEVLIIDEHASGGVNESRVYIAEIAKRLLLSNASFVILIHNHPSGNLQCSQADIQITEKIREALAYFDIKVLDHLIVGSGASDFISFKELGYI